jgi:hypothetical protein
MVREEEEGKMMGEKKGEVNFTPLGFILRKETVLVVVLVLD